MLTSWGGADDWSRRERAADRVPDSRADIPPERWAALADRARSTPAPRHVGRESSQALAGRLAALERLYGDLADRHAAALANVDALRAERVEMDAVERSRDYWRRRAAYAEAGAPSRLGSWVAGFLSALVCLGAWWALGQVLAAVVRHIAGG